LTENATKLPDENKEEATRFLVTKTCKTNNIK
jgi:hypothetical protein